MSPGMITVMELYSAIPKMYLDSLLKNLYHSQAPISRTERAELKAAIRLRAAVYVVKHSDRSQESDSEPGLLSLRLE